MSVGVQQQGLRAEERECRWEGLQAPRLVGMRVVGGSGAEGVKAQKCVGSGGKTNIESVMIDTSRGRCMDLGECVGWGGQTKMKGWMGIGIVQNGMGAMGGRGSLGSVKYGEERTMERSVVLQLRRDVREWISRYMDLCGRIW